MKDMNYYLDKLMRMAEEFDQLYRDKEYGRAKWVVLKAQVIATFFELPQQTMSELFGNWPDDGDDESVPPPGLFDWDRVHDVNTACCVRQHKSYQDIAARRAGLPLQYYSDPDYCALKCKHASPGHREMMEGIRERMQV